MTAARLTTKRDYQQALRVVGEVIRAWDPYALLAGGAPDDEFDGEIAAIVRQAGRIHSPGDAAAVISEVFSASFEPDLFDADDCSDVGRQLFESLTRSGLASGREKESAESS